MKSKFIISLDFELLWGVKDVYSKDEYGDNVLGARSAVPMMLDLFKKNKISATWAAVGFLFCENIDEIYKFMPASNLIPKYMDAKISNYSYFNELGENEDVDSFHYASSLIKTISRVPGQEIASHTFSHYYVLEPGATDKTFEADLESALAIAEERGLKLTSIVFPRNQYNTRSLEICRSLGFTAWRGNQKSWMYRTRSSDELTLACRGARFVDSYVNFTGYNLGDIRNGEFRECRASFFLRPRTKALFHAHRLHINRLKLGMLAAAMEGKEFHLWWHPHNFGINTAANLEMLTEIVEFFGELRNEYGMQSVNMKGQAL